MNNKGQAFLEGIFILPIVVVLIFSVVWFGRVLLTWQQLISATRYGTDMIANTSLSKEDIKKDIENYLTHRMIEGRKLDKEKIKEIKVDIKDYTTPEINILNIKQKTITIYQKMTSENKKKCFLDRISNL